MGVKKDEAGKCLRAFSLGAHAFERCAVLVEHVSHGVWRCKNEECKAAEPLHEAAEVAALAEGSRGSKKRRDDNLPGCRNAPDAEACVYCGEEPAKSQVGSFGLSLDGLLMACWWLPDGQLSAGSWLAEGRPITRPHCKCPPPPRRDSQPAPERNPDPAHPGLWIVTAENFEELVIHSDVHFFLLLSADWCPPSKAMKPDWYMLAKLLATSKQVVDS